MPSPVKEDLLPRAFELLSRAERGEITHTPFLSPAEHLRIQRALGAREDVYAFGGYKEAERVRLFFLPPYMTQADEQTRSEWLSPALEETVIPLEIRCSGFRTLSHRDYLGAILALGIERDALGDLCVPDAQHAVTFCDRVIAEFLTQTLTRVANDAVRVTPCTLPQDFDGGRQFRRINDTVASPRADSVVAALANLSRERAQAIMREGLVEIDYESADKPDRLLCAPCVIVIRGKGKFILRSVAGLTKKGRYRLVADQYL